MKNAHLDKCVDCLAGKQNRVAFRPRPLMRRKTTLELVHTYVCCVDARSHSGGQYLVTFIDDYNHKLWPYVLNMEDQVLSVFKEFQAQTESESKQKLKVVWTQGIHLEYIVPKTPELNDMAERMNRTIMGRV